MTTHIHSTQAARLTSSPQVAVEAELRVDKKRRWNITPFQQRCAERGIHTLFFIKEEEFYGGWK